MSVMESTDATVILQSDFSGGMNMLNPKENQFLDGRNGIVRDVGYMQKFFERLQKIELKLNPAKCTFGAS